MESRTTAASQPVRHNRSTRWRSFLIGLLIAVSCLGFGAYVLTYWMERQVLTTDNWVALVSPLPKNPEVSAALGNYVSDQVFSDAAVQAKIADALPPKAAFLAAPLTGQLKDLTTRLSQRIVMSDGFQTVWAGANRLAMNRLLTTSRGQPPPLQQKINERFNIDISGIQGQLRGALGSASNAIPALQPASQQAINISTDLRARADRVRQTVRTVDTLAVILPLVVLASFLSALAVSRNRRRIALIFTVVIIFLMLVELIALNWLRQETLAQVQNPGNLTAVGVVFDAVVGWLRRMIYTVIVIAAIVCAILAAFGPSRWARSFRAYIHLDRLKNPRLSSGVRDAREWIKKREYYLWAAIALIVLILVALFATASTQVVINMILIYISLVALLHILAHPRSPGELGLNNPR